MVLEFLMNFCILIVLLSFIWKYVFVLPYTLITAWNKHANIFSLIIKVLGYYITAAIMSLVVTGTIQSTDSMWLKILIGFLGTLIYYSITGDALNQKSKAAQADYDYETLESLNKDYILQLASVLLFIVMIFIPRIAINAVTLFIINILDKIYHLGGFIGNVLRIILSLVGAYQAFLCVGGTIIMIIALIGLAISSLFKNKVDNEESL